MHTNLYELSFLRVKLMKQFPGHRRIRGYISRSIRLLRLRLNWFHLERIERGQKNETAAIEYV